MTYGFGGLWHSFLCPAKRLAAKTPNGGEGIRSPETRAKHPDFVRQGGGPPKKGLGPFPYWHDRFLWIFERMHKNYDKIKKYYDTIIIMKKIILLPLVLCIAACAAQDPNKPWTVQNGSPCPKEGMTARDTDGDVAKCVEVGQ